MLLILVDSIMYIKKDHFIREIFVTAISLQNKLSHNFEAHHKEEFSESKDPQPV